MYGSTAELPAPTWSWVEDQLAHAGTYWVNPHGVAGPHPRPVWGVYRDGLELSIGSSVLARAIAADARVSVHLSSDTDVVILEGRAEPTWPDDRTAGFLAAYNAKYDWDYVIDVYGTPTLMTIDEVITWRSAGWAGREGFRSAAKWTR